MKRISKPARSFRAWGIVGLILGIAGAAPAAYSQSEDCDSLRQQLAMAGRGDPGRAAQFARAAQRQRIELQRTQDYADQIGCDSGLFSIFSNSPPQCDGIRAQIGRMTGNLNALEAQIDLLQRGDPQRQADLQAQYQSSCARPQDAYGSDPNQGPRDDGMRQGYDDQDQPIDDGDTQHRGGSKAICVRTCDGGYFPLTSVGAQHDLNGLQALCTALCPNAEARLYTTADTDDIGSAVTLDGARYTDLPAAFQYQKTFSPTCSCKPPNKSWVEALADAEKLLGNSGANDITVTAKMSDDMARPGAAPPAALVKGKAAKSRRKAKADLQADAQTALATVGAQAPTASTESSGIVTDTGPADTTVKSDVGTVETQDGPDGAKRRVRIIAPRL